MQILLRKGRRISTKKEGEEAAGEEEDKSFWSSRQTTMVFVLVPFLFILCLPCVCSETDGHNQTNHTLQKLNRINAHLKLINKPSIKTIKVCSYFLLPPFLKQFMLFVIQVQHLNNCLVIVES